MHYFKLITCNIHQPFEISTIKGPNRYYSSPLNFLRFLLDPAISSIAAVPMICDNLLFLEQIALAVFVKRAYMLRRFLRM